MKSADAERHRSACRGAAVVARGDVNERRRIRSMSVARFT